MKHPREARGDAGYTRKPGDRKPKPGGHLAEAAKRLSRRPEIMSRLSVFVDMWGVDGYDPFSDEGCSSAVLQIVICALNDARHIRAHQ